MNHVMDEIEARAHRQLHRMRELGEQMNAIRVRESSADGSITAAVDGNGALVDLVFTSAVSKMSPGDFEKLLVTTAGQAAARAFAERGDLINQFNGEAAGESE